MIFYDTLIQHFITKLNSIFSIKQLPQLDYFHGIDVYYLKVNSLMLTKRKYIRDLLQKTSLTEAKFSPSPMTSSWKQYKTGSN